MHNWDEALKQLSRGELDFDAMHLNVSATVERIPAVLVPRFVGVCRALLEIQKKAQSVDGDLAEGLLLVVILLPQFVLRVASNDDVPTQTSKISRALHLFEEGKWLRLTKELFAQGKRRRAFLASNLDTVQHITSEEKAKRAEDLVAGGALGKARTVLTSEGLAQGNTDDIKMDLLRRHPQRKHSWDVCSESEAASLRESGVQLDRLLLLKTCMKAKPLKCADQYGWRVREYLGHLLRDVECGTLLASQLMQPLSTGTLRLSTGCLSRVAGGRLFALSKAPKRGVRPIVVSDAFRSLTAQALFQHSQVSKELQDYFLRSHPRVQQFGVGVPHGATTLVHVVSAIIGGVEVDVAADGPLSIRDVAVVSLDVHNAFNEVSRRSVFEAVHNSRGAKYSTSLLQRFAPFLELVYGKQGKLSYRSPAGERVDILSAEGTHQGDVFSPCLFAATIHPEICECMDGFPNVCALLWADNIFLLGPLEDCAQAARDIRDRLPSKGLELNEDESVAFVRNWHARAECDTPWSELCGVMDEVCIRYAQSGIKVVGVPLGSQAFINSTLDGVMQRLEFELDKISVVTDGVRFLQLLRFCENAMFDHIIGALPPLLCERHAKAFDKAILRALEAYCAFPVMVDSTDAQVFAEARHCFRDSTACGGLGLTSVACKSVPAFYAASAHSIRFIATMPALVDILERSRGVGGMPSLSDCDGPRAFGNFLTSEFADVEEVLLQHGCVKQLRSSQILRGPNPVLPCFAAVLGCERDPEGAMIPIPPQKVLTKAYVPNIRTQADSLLSKTQCWLKSQRSSVSLGDHQESPILPWLGVPKTEYRSFKLTYSPMAFLSARPCTRFHNFSQGEFALWVRSMFGLPFDNGDNAGFCAGFGNTCHEKAHCNEEVDRWGHHLRTCAEIGAKDKCWTRAHDFVLQSFNCVLSQTDFTFTTYDGDVAQHSPQDGKKGDLWIQEPILNCTGLIADFKLTHPVVGVASKKAQLGQIKPRAVAEEARDKRNKHARPYEVAKLRFIPLIASTYGEVNDEMIRLIWAIARRAASTRFVELDAANQGEKSSDRKGQIYTQMRGVVAAAVAHAGVARIMHSALLDGCGLPKRQYRKRKQQPEYDIHEALSSQTS